MTANLDHMMQLLEHRVAVEANIMAAQHVSQKAELGWFDTEFTMYGCAYLEARNGKMYYKVSSQPEDIYDYLEIALLQDIFPSNVTVLSQKCPVPAGSEQFIAQDVKKQLAYQMKKICPRDYFEHLSKLAEYYRDDTAAPLLWEMAESLEGLFSREKLNEFVDIVRYAYSCLRITRSTYRELMNWVGQEEKNMDDDIISKDIFETTMYGIAFEKDGRLRYAENAQRELIYEKMYALEQQGEFVTPVYHKTFWYNYEYRLVDVVKDFKRQSRNHFNSAYLNMIKKIKKRTAKQDENGCLQNELVALQEQGAPDCLIDTMKRYGNRWGIF